MTRFTSRPRASRRHFATKPRLSLLAVALLGALVFASSAHAVALPVPLGTTASFAVLGGTGVGGGLTNTGVTTTNGDFGSLPNATYADTGSTVFIAPAVNHAGDGVTFGAKAALGTAYDNARAQPQDFPVVASLGGTTVGPGVYHTAGTLDVNGPFVLNGNGDPNAIFVFQGTSITTSPNTVVSLIGNAQACNVFWQTDNSATLGVGSTFVGTIFALTSISIGTNAVVNGRALARNGQVTMDTNTFIRPFCATPSTPTPFTPVPTTPVATTPVDTSAADAAAAATAQFAEFARVTAARATAARVAAEAAQATAARQATARRRAAARKRAAVKREKARRRATAIRIRQRQASPPTSTFGFAG